MFNLKETFIVQSAPYSDSLKALGYISEEGLSINFVHLKNYEISTVINKVIRQVYNIDRHTTLLLGEARFS